MSATAAPTPLDAAMLADRMVARAIAAPPRDRRAVSPEVAAQMLALLGDNENWAVTPDVEQMKVWALVRHTMNRPDDTTLIEKVEALFPEHVEAYRSGWKSWGHQWLRDCAGERVDQ